VGDGLQLSSHLQLLSLSARQIACTVILHFIQNLSLLFSWLEHGISRGFADKGGHSFDTERLPVLRDKTNFILFAILYDLFSH
ncbi:hypothetical protein GOODEAATRI_012545, partial [Goodea atripinnis]